MSKDKSREYDLVAIACVGEDWAIGKAGGLAFNSKDDMEFFKNETKGAVVGMGYATMKSLPGQKPLKGRVNCVLAPEGAEVPEGFLVAHSVEDLADMLKAKAKELGVRAYVIGGGSVYRQMLPYCGMVILNQVNATCEGADTFFPDMDEEDAFELVLCSDYKPADVGMLRKLVYMNVAAAPKLPKGALEEAI